MYVNRGGSVPVLWMSLGFVLDDEACNGTGNLNLMHSGFACINELPAYLSGHGPRIWPEANISPDPGS